MKKVICFMLLVVLVLGICGCDQTTSGADNTQPEMSADIDIPQALCGTWYPQPEVNSDIIEIRADGTCVVGGSELTYTVVSRGETELVLDAQWYTLTFTHMDSSFPLLFEESSGVCVPDRWLWLFVGDWQSEDGSNHFSLNFEDILAKGGQIDVGENILHIIVQDDSDEVYNISFFAEEECPVAEFVDPQGNSMLFFNMAYGIPDSNPGADDLYQQTITNLNALINEGSIEIRTNSDSGITVRKITGQEALILLYEAFQDLAGKYDVQEYLDRFELCEGVLTGTLDTMANGSLLEHAVDYNALGQPKIMTGSMSLFSEDYCYFTYDNLGNVKKAAIFGTIVGEPIFDANGRLESLKMSTGTASLIYNEKGQIVRIEMPFSFTYPWEDPTDDTEVQEFVYDEAGRLIQRRITITTTDLSWEKYGINQEAKAAFYERNGFYFRELHEYRYDSQNRIVEDRCNIKNIAPITGDNLYDWSYAVETYSYGEGAYPLSAEQIYYHVTSTVDGKSYYDKWTALRMQMFNSADLEQALLTDFSEYIHPTHVQFETQYIYGTVYRYNAEP